MVEGGGCRNRSGAQVSLWNLCCGFGLVWWFVPGARKASLVLCHRHWGMLGWGLGPGWLKWWLSACWCQVSAIMLCPYLPSCSAPPLWTSPKSFSTTVLNQGSGKTVASGFWPEVWVAPNWVSSLGRHGAKKQCERSDWIMTILLARRIFTSFLIHFHLFRWSGSWWDILVLCLFLLSASRWTNSVQLPDCPLPSLLLALGTGCWGGCWALPPSHQELCVPGVALPCPPPSLFYFPSHPWEGGTQPCLVCWFFKNNLFMSTLWLPSCWFSNNNNNICYSLAAKYWLFLRAVLACFVFHFIYNNRMDEGVQCHKSSLPQQDNIQAFLANMNADDRFEGFLFYSGFQSH